MRTSIGALALVLSSLYKYGVGVASLPVGYFPFLLGMMFLLWLAGRWSGNPCENLLVKLAVQQGLKPTTEGSMAT